MHLPNPPLSVFPLLMEPQDLSEGMLQRKENIINLPWKTFSKLLHYFSIAALPNLLVCNMFLERKAICLT